MARAPQHTYQILTKRPDRMLDVLTAADSPDVARTFEKTYGQQWPPDNWWFGVSVEDQGTADHRLPILLKCFASVRFVSYEPALGPVDFAEAVGGAEMFTAVDWLICGGESGPHARPMHPAWARSARDICQQTGVAFFFKQWGEFAPGHSERGFTQWPDITSNKSVLMPAHPGRAGRDEHQIMNRVGKHNAGAVLDGVEWKDFPQC
jgi:protein gp37